MPHGDLFRDEQCDALRRRVRDEVRVGHAQLVRDGLYQGVLSDRAHLEEDLADRPSGLQLTFQRFGKLLARDQALFDEHLTQRFQPSRHPISPVDVVDPRPFMAFSSAFGLRARPLYLAERPRR